MDKYYTVVGTLERRLESYRVIEHMLPSFFKNLLQHKHGRQQQRSSFKSPHFLLLVYVNKYKGRGADISPKARNKLKKMLANEYILYRKVQQKLDGQIKELKLKLK